jgi:hypothetical protein
VVAALMKTFHPAALPILFYKPEDKEAKHAIANRFTLKDMRDPDPAFSVCTTRLPACICMCRRFFLARVE